MAIHWHDNIPVISWLLLRGRCRACHAHIAVRYPLVEGITGMAFLGSFLALGAEPAVLLAWFLSATVVTLLFIEHDTGLIPDRLAFPAVACSLAASIALDPGQWWYYLAGCLGAGAVALVLSFVTPGATRFSEAKMALLLGAALGPYVMVALPIAFSLRMLAGMTLVFGQNGRLRARTVCASNVADRDTRKHVEALHTNDPNVEAEVMTWL
jgi:leader peptidase (prepilin peptidase)/N-methyltransferase